MNKKVFLTAFWLIVILSSIEVIVFFVLMLFKPIDQVFRHNIDIPRIVPTFSDLFTPMSFSRFVTLQDQQKNFYSEKLDDFSGALGSVMRSESSFVKEAEASYIVAGQVLEIIRQVDEKKDNYPIGYELILENLYKSKHKENINLSEVGKVDVYLRLVSTSGFSRSVSTLEDVRVGDYIVIKRATSLLSREKLAAIEVEILRRQD